MENVKRIGLLPETRIKHEIKDMVRYILTKLVLLFCFLFIHNEMVAQTSKSVDNSVLASGKWVKISTSGQGIHRLPFSFLTEIGINDPSNVRVFGNGGYMVPMDNADLYPEDLRQISTWTGKDKGGNDCVFFYAEGMVEWQLKNDTRFQHVSNCYADKAYYFLSSDVGTVNEVTAQVTPDGEIAEEVNVFDDYTVYEEDKVNLIHSGQLWLDNKMSNGATKDIDFSFDNLSSSTPVKITMAGATRDTRSSAFGITVKGNEEELSFPGLPYNGSASLTYARYGDGTYDMSTSTGNFTVNIQFKGNLGVSSGWIDYVEVQVKRNLSFSGDQMNFRSIAAMSAGVSQYNLQNIDGVRVLNITDLSNIKEMQVETSGSSGTFKYESDQLEEFIAFKPNVDYPIPNQEGDVENQNLHAIQNVELLVVSHGSLLSEANRLADFHRQKDNMSVEVVTASQVYNEFASGMSDASGIRNLVKHIYNKQGSPKLKYLLLFGDGSYDNKNIHGENHHLIPTYQTKESLHEVNSYVTDDFFGIVEDEENEWDYHATVDIGIGRLPASDLSEAKVLVDKIIHYVSSASLGEWRNDVCFIADDADGSTEERFVLDSEVLGVSVQNDDASFNLEKVYLDAFKEEQTPAGERYPDVVSAIGNAVKNGVLILNYMGHANDKFLASEQVLGINDIDGWSNYDNLPIFVTATCEFSRFDSEEVSAGEHILLNPYGGGIALFSTTRSVYAGPNFTLSKNFYSHIFDQDEDGENLKMGDVMRIAKNTTSGLNKRNFSLLADPALSLSFPQYQVTTERINGVAVDELNDTIKAMQTVTVNGRIKNIANETVADFNGEVVPIIYDKAYELETLGNGGQPKVKYELQNNVIYRGTASVVNGEFSFTFVVPKDIAYQFGEGKISYYAYDRDHNKDAKGHYSQLIVGGSDDSVDDNTGPVIALYMDDKAFENGGTTSANPLLLVDLADEHGINTLSSSIGHDITLVIDDDYSKLIVLNDYYTADKDDYQKGGIQFQLSNLEPGIHRLKLKAWDVLGNSSEAELEFEVTDDFYISELGNYPNPFSESTTFYYKHNKIGEQLTALFEVFDNQGKLIFTHQEKFVSSTNNGKNFVWNPLAKGVRLRGGVYIVRLTLTDSQGNETNRSSRIISLP
ncbi:type IX secretion system sortase PorU [Puteibacter caeruleilacunae]|nr:type IX secretion system sortase PorU [Puteibacter caeruleilacunae]